MLSYFPTPYPDELFYSILTRYHIRSGNKSFNQSLLEVLGHSPQQLCNLELPNNLEFLVKHLPVASKYSIESLIYNHTLYSFYKIFLTLPEAFLLKELMRKKTGKPIFQVARMAVSDKRENRQALRFCHQCFEEDFQKYGEVYWHRTHQTPGICICLTHRTILQGSLVLLQEGYLACHAADSENCPVHEDKVVYTDDIIQQLLAIAQGINWLSKSNFDFKGLQWLRSCYQRYLSEQGFITNSASKSLKFDRQKFADAVFDFYGHEFWNVIKPGLAAQSTQYFAHCLFACDMAPVTDRLTHIVLIRFLSSSLKDFFNEQ